MDLVVKESSFHSQDEASSGISPSPIFPSKGQYFSEMEDPKLIRRIQLKNRSRATNGLKKRSKAIEKLQAQIDIISKVHDTDDGTTWRKKILKKSTKHHYRYPLDYLKEKHTPSSNQLVLLTGIKQSPSNLSSYTDFSTVMDKSKISPYKINKLPPKKRKKFLPDNLPLKIEKKQYESISELKNDLIKLRSLQEKEIEKEKKKNEKNQFEQERRELKTGRTISLRKEDYGNIKAIQKEKENLLQSYKKQGFNNLEEIFKEVPNRKTRKKGNDSSPVKTIQSAYNSESSKHNKRPRKASISEQFPRYRRNRKYLPHKNAAAEEVIQRKAKIKELISFRNAYLKTDNSEMKNEISFRVSNIPIHNTFPLENGKMHNGSYQIAKELESVHQKSYKKLTKKKSPIKKKKTKTPKKTVKKIIKKKNKRRKINSKQEENQSFKNADFPIINSQKRRRGEEIVDIPVVRIPLTEFLIEENTNPNSKNKKEEEAPKHDGMYGWCIEPKFNQQNRVDESGEEQNGKRIEDIKLPQLPSINPMKQIEEVKKKGDSNILPYQILDFRTSAKVARKIESYKNNQKNKKRKLDYTYREEGLLDSFELDVDLHDFSVNSLGRTTSKKRNKN